jgi:hypothetical protein
MYTDLFEQPVNQGFRLSASIAIEFRMNRVDSQRLDPNEDNGR